MTNFEAVTAHGSINCTTAYSTHTHYHLDAGAIEPSALNPHFDGAKRSIERYELTVALEILDRIEREQAGLLSDYTWFRLYRLRGDALRRRGDAEGAAKCFLKAKQARPDAEDAAWLEAFAYQLLGDPARAYDLATKARARYPESAKAGTLWLQTAPLETSLAELEAAIPAHQRSDVDISLGLAVAATSRQQHDAAVRHAKAAMDAAPESLDAKLLWASAVVDRLARGAPSAVTEVEPGLLTQAIATLEDVIPRVSRDIEPADAADGYGPCR